MPPFPESLTCVEPEPLRLALPRAVFWLAALAFALRVGVRLFSGAGGFWRGGYTFFFSLAQSLAAGRGLALNGAPTAIRVPLYPLFLTAVTFGHRAFWPVVLAQSAIGAGTVIGAAALTRLMFQGRAGRSAATIAAALVAVYPYYVVHDTALQETGLYTFVTLMAVLALWIGADRGGPARGAWAGGLLGLDVLTRATIAPFAVLAPVWLVWRKRAGAGAMCALLLAALVLPWVWRNSRLTGVPTLTTDAGIHFWAGNTNAFFRYYPRRSADRGSAAALATLTDRDRAELARFGGNSALSDQWFARKALVEIASHPGVALANGVRKNAAAFGWVLSPRRGPLDTLVYACSYGPVMLLGLWGMWRRRACWREDSVIYGLSAVFIAITAAVWGHTSHRSYLDVYWMVFGAGALAETLNGRAFQAALLGDTLRSMCQRQARNVARRVLRRPVQRADNASAWAICGHILGVRRIGYVTQRPLAGEGACSHALGMVFARCLAEGLGVPYAHTPFGRLSHAVGPPDEFARRWEDMLGLGLGEMPAARALGRGVDLTDVAGSDVWNPRTVRRLCALIPPMLPGLRAAYYRDRAPQTNRRLMVALHVRRGDVSPARNRHLWTPPAEVRHQADAIAAVLSRIDVEYEMLVVSQGRASDFPEFAGLDCRFVLDEDALVSFSRLVEADVLVMARSTYSYVAGLLSDGVVVYRQQAHPPQPGWLGYPDGRFDAAAFEARVRAVVDGRPSWRKPSARDAPALHS